MPPHCWPHVAVGVAVGRQVQAVALDLGVVLQVVQSAALQVVQSAALQVILEAVLAVVPQVALPVVRPVVLATGVLHPPCGW